MEQVTLGSGLSAGALFVAMGISALITSVFIWIGALLAKVEGAGFVRSLAVAILNSIIGWITIVALGAAGVPLPACLLIGFVITLFLIRAIFGTTWGKAFLTWLFALVAQIIVAIVVGIGGFAMFGGFSR